MKQHTLWNATATASAALICSLLISSHLVLHVRSQPSYNSNIDNNSNNNNNNLYSLTTKNRVSLENSSNNSEEPTFLYPGGDISEESACTVEELEYANDAQLHAILQELVNTTFFRTFLVDLDHGCPLVNFHGMSSNKEQLSSSDRDNSLSSSAKIEHEQEEDEFECSGGKEELDEEAPPLCTVDTHQDDANLFGGGSMMSFSSSALGHIQQQSSWESESQERTFSWKNPSDPVVSGVDEENCSDEDDKKKGGLKLFSQNKDFKNGNLDATFWLDMCSKIKEGTGAKVVNLALNPERNTGYNGTHIWQAIYEENCINLDDKDEMCFEEKVLYRLFSGLHTSTTLSIAKNYYPPSKRKGRESWEPNPQFFMEKFAGHPEYIRNLHFSYVVLLRALRRVSPYLYEYSYNHVKTGNIVEDEAASVLIRRLLDSHILNSCSTVFSAFDETLMFESSTAEASYSIEQNFKDVFHNVSSILDCVQCQQCKLHGKMAMLGYGTALKILLTPEEILMDGSHLTRNELVAFVNTLARMSESMKEVRELSHLYFMESEKFANELPIVDPKKDEVSHWNEHDHWLENKSELNKYMDRAVSLISELRKSGYLDDELESMFMSLAFAKDPSLLILVKYYGNDANKLQKYLQYIVSDLDDTHNKSEDEPDAIVVGSGLAGLAATLKILDRGGSVVLIEKEHRIGGNSAKASSGINACCPQNNTYGDSLYSFEADTVRSAGDAANLPLIKTLVSKSSEAVSYLKERAGVDLSLLAQLGGHSHKRTHRPNNGMAGAEIIYSMQKAVKKFEKSGKLKLMIDTKVTSLVERNGTIIGLNYTTVKDGDTIKSSVLAPNVILATGGFASDRSDGSYLSQYRPELLKFPATAGDFSTGDGIAIATTVGAGIVDLEKVQIHPTGWVDPNYPTNPTKVLAAELMRGVGGILLNESGLRFCNELGTRAYVTDMMLKHDTQYASSGKWSLDADVPTFSLVLSSSAAYDGQKHVDLYTHKGLMTKLQGIKELASWMGIDEKILRQTLTQYNDDAKNGKDIWGKTSFRGVPEGDLEKEIFYAGKVTPVLHYCMGGIKIDTNGSVLNHNGDIIPGLHAAGEVTGGVHGNNRLGGNSLLECTVFGSIVGEKVPIRKIQPLPSHKTGEKHEGSTRTEPEKVRKISMNELSQHNSPDNCWVAINGEVYDLTEFAEEHPPGADSIHSLAGRDGTEAFNAVHNQGLLSDFADDKVGILSV